jgi:hypothetical protein
MDPLNAVSHNVVVYKNVSTTNEDLLYCNNTQVHTGSIAEHSALNDFYSHLSNIYHPQYVTSCVRSWLRFLWLVIKINVLVFI